MHDVSRLFTRLLALSLLLSSACADLPESANLQRSNASSSKPFGPAASDGTQAPKRQGGE